MKIVAVADTHGSDFVDKIPECDLLLIAGDISPMHLVHDFYHQRAWFQSDFISQLIKLKDKVGNIVFIGGNHDTYLSECNISGNNDSIKKILPDNVHYLCDELINIKGISIYGSPWCNLPFWGAKGPPVWNFALSDAELAEKYSKIPKDIDILLTHGPSFGFCDVILEDAVNDLNMKKWNAPPDHLGSKSLYEAIKLNKIAPKYVISGHIHSAAYDRDFAAYKPSLDDPSVKFACASILNEDYKFSDLQPPLIIIIKDESEKEKEAQN